MTPLVSKIHQRSKRFHAEIARKAALLNAPKPSAEYKELWFGIVEEIKRPLPILERIIFEVSKQFGVSRHDILSDRKPNDVVFARQVAMHLSKKLTPHTLPAIGRKFNRDHTTVLHSVNKIEASIRSDSDLAARLTAIKLAVLA